MTKNVELKPSVTKPLGQYLVEAGIITSDQLETALAEQQQTEKRIGEILSVRGWVKQETIEYVMKNIVLPEREIDEQKLPNETLFRSNSRFATSQNIYLSPQKIVRFLLILVFSIIFVCVLVQASTYLLPSYPLQDTLVSLFNIDGEQNVPAFFSWSLLLFCALLLGAIAYSKKANREPYASHWTALAIIFFYLYIDEAIGIHERIGLIVRDKFNPSGFFYFAWTIPGSILTIICFLAFLRFINSLPSKIKYLFLLAGSMYVGGALLVEMCNGYYRSLYGDSPIYYALTAVEEGMEMLGIVTFIYGLMTYISSSMKGIHLSVRIPAKKVKN
ncbi:MAG: hypothetical protein CLLPBCKN_003626 [Chroococcidiopsis cubana SAG 39.79]|uniref:DUF2157 domain-containing protein n=1 Tax=Chroococcidiopsis cubana SAG 39.79 TaxID=388085 RepID=A0AB37URE6_9CYAN|nr:hypothetical protein [Chroococcidiopsis cubana]MDZ4874230.1 hypothetical protein [Chroococcidiopsis cubana SAG 39.79]PSB65082.1 hypothetical protein C7B79_06985 [Chroococcidiopsis cubana CCALA 043]RUT13829.1 hypothetical protein DSM107010_07290 [Chroococcidiopsis cubana SAG 39.79]